MFLNLALAASVGRHCHRIAPASRIRYKQQVENRNTKAQQKPTLAQAIGATLIDRSSFRKSVSPTFFPLFFFPWNIPALWPQASGSEHHHHSDSSEKRGMYRRRHWRGRGKEAHYIYTISERQGCIAGIALAQHKYWPHRLTDGVSGFSYFVNWIPTNVKKKLWRHQPASPSLGVKRPWP